VFQLTTRSPMSEAHAALRGDLPDRHARALVLGDVCTGGMPAFDLALIRARAGDRVVATMTVGELLRALPGVGWLTAHDLLRYAGVGNDTRVSDLTPAQHGRLAVALSRVVAAPGGGTLPL
jgi:hypothetical protein